MLLRLPGFTGVFEEAEQECDVLDANSLMTVSDHFRRSLSGASGNCCEQAERWMEFTSTSSHVRSPLHNFTVIMLSFPRSVSFEREGCWSGGAKALALF